MSSLSINYNAPRAFEVINKDNKKPVLLLPHLMAYPTLTNSDIINNSSSSNNDKFSFQFKDINTNNNSYSYIPTPISTPLNNSKFINNNNYNNFNKKTFRRKSDIISPSSSRVHTPPITIPTSPELSPSPSNNTNSATASKRQRIGPSCDTCRLKKTKCNAKIEIILFDTDFLNKSSKLNNVLNSNLLHYQLNLNDINNLINYFSSIENNNTTNIILIEKLNNLKENEKLIKHLDKLILFTPCSSCVKRNLNINCICNFSKGFTRSDINAFKKMLKKSINKKSIYQLDINDYNLTSI